MMKKVFVVFIIFISINLIGCGFLPGYKNPSSITIDGEQYVSGFYDDLYALIEQQDLSTSLFIEGNYHWWKYNGDEPFELYYAEHKDALMWKPTFYCKKSEFDKVKEYYSNLSNFKYYICEYLSDVTYEVNGNDIILENIVQTILGNTEEYSNEIVLTLDDYLQISFYRKSIGGLFLTTKARNILHDQKFYVLQNIDGSNDKYYLLEFNKEHNDEIIRIINEVLF